MAPATQHVVCVACSRAAASVQLLCGSRRLQVEEVLTDVMICSVAVAGTYGMEHRRNLQGICMYKSRHVHWLGVVSCSVGPGTVARRRSQAPFGHAPLSELKTSA